MKAKTRQLFFVKRRRMRLTASALLVSVKHDPPNDVISLGGAVLIAQFLVGNVDAFYEP